jgi:hypothetical protein
MIGCVLQDDLKKFISEPPPPPQEVEIPEEGKTVGVLDRQPIKGSTRSR